MRPIRVQPMLVAVVAIALVLIGTAAGYWLGQDEAKAAKVVSAFDTTPVTAQNPQPSNRTPLYYQDPDGRSDYSPVPKRTAAGRDFVPVYDDNGPSPGRPAATQTTQQSKGRILYYRNPMGLPDTSPVLKKDSMGMAYIPVYESEAPADFGIVQVSPGRLQMLGVRTAPVEIRATLPRTIRANGAVEIDERNQTVVTTKVAGWIERLNVAATGQPVRRGQPLFEFYSPDLNAAEEEFLIAAQLNVAGNHEGGTHIPAEAIVDASLERLRTLDVPEDEIARLRRTGEVSRRITVASPANGVVLEKPAIEGAHVDSGMPLFKIADLSTVWLIADVQEQDLANLRIGAPAHVSFVSFPGRVFNGRVDYIYPTLNTDTRTARVRIVLPNPALILRASMYASVEIDLPGASTQAQMLVVPDSAIIDSGTQQAVLIERGEGRFEPRTVHVGERGNGYAQVLDGVKQGDRVVTSANFLIDAESNLRAALSSFAAAQSAAAKPTPVSGK